MSEKPNKSPFAGDGSWNVQEKRAAAPSRPPSSPLPFVLGAIAIAVAGVVVLVLVLSRRPPPTPSIAPAASEPAQATIAPTGESTALPQAPPPAPTAIAEPAESSPNAAPSSSTPGARDEAAIVLRRLRPRTKACFEQALKTNPDAGGRLTLDLDVGADGRVTTATVTGGRPPSLGACIQKVAATLAFAPGAPRKITMPLALTSQ